MRPTSVMGASKRLGKPVKILDLATMLTKIKELIPAYTGWPRKKQGKEGEFTTETQRGKSTEEEGKLGGETA